MKNNNNGKTLLIYLLVSVAIICGLVYMLTSMSTKSSDKKYSEIMEQFDSLNVSQFELDLGSGQLKYKLKGEDRYIVIQFRMFHCLQMKSLAVRMLRTIVRNTMLKIQTILCSIILYRYRITASGSI